MTNEQLKELSKIQEYVYVVGEKFVVYKYPVSKITYTGRRSIFDIPMEYGDLEVFTTEGEAQDYVRECKEDKINDLLEELDCIEYRIDVLKRDIKSKKDVEVIEICQET